MMTNGQVNSCKEALAACLDKAMSEGRQIDWTEFAGCVYDPPVNGYTQPRSDGTLMFVIQIGHKMDGTK